MRPPPSAAAIRPAGPEDAAPITAVINRAFEVERFFVDAERTSVPEVEALMQDGTFFVATTAPSGGGEPVGTVYATRGPEGRGSIGLLAVLPPVQGRGIGRQLMRVAEDHCRDLGCAGIDIRIVNLRTELPPFYTMLGYRETGVAPYPDARAQLPCYFVLMSKELR
jgi:predicted N-acetyltransferase YhbS